MFERSRNTKKSNDPIYNPIWVLGKTIILKSDKIQKKSLKSGTLVPVELVVDPIDN